MTGVLQVGARAPEFRLPTDEGGTVGLSDLSGRKAVIFFYPKADTPGCTLEAKDFNRLRSEFTRADTVLIGVSADPVAAQGRFKAKYGLAISLASDPAQEMLRAYGVWAKKSLFGRKYMGIVRTTVLLDRDGRVARIWPNVRVSGHAAEVLKAARAL
jgi:peroxiredoxin Q/BCP